MRSFNRTVQLRGSPVLLRESIVFSYGVLRGTSASTIIGTSYFTATGVYKRFLYARFAEGNAVRRLSRLNCTKNKSEFFRSSRVWEYVLVDASLRLGESNLVSISFELHKLLDLTEESGDELKASPSWVPAKLSFPILISVNMSTVTFLNVFISVAPACFIVLLIKPCRSNPYFLRIGNHWNFR